MQLSDDFLNKVFNKIKEDKVTIIEIFQNKLINDLEDKTIKDVRIAMIERYGVTFQKIIKEIFHKKITNRELANNAGNAIKDTIVTAIKKGSVRASDDVIESRREICKNCEYVKITKTRTGSIKKMKCGKCGCSVRMKTLLVSQKCPKGFW